MPTKVTTVTPEYKAWDYETLAKPLEQMTQYYDTIDAAQQKIGAEAGALGDLLTPADPFLTHNYNEFMGELSAARDSLLTKGELRKGEKAVGDLQQKYATHVAPIQKASEYRAKMVEDFDKNMDKTNGSMLYEYDPRLLSLDAIYRSGYNIRAPKWYSGEKLLSEFRDMVSRLQNVDTGGVLPGDGKWENILGSVFGDKYWQAVSSTGITPGMVWQEIMSGDEEGLFNSLARLKLASTGIGQWGSDATVNQAMRIMAEGFWNAVGSDRRVTLGAAGSGGDGKDNSDEGPDLLKNWRRVLSPMENPPFSGEEGWRFSKQKKERDKAQEDLNPVSGLISSILEDTEHFPDGKVDVGDTSAYDELGNGADSNAIVRVNEIYGRHYLDEDGNPATWDGDVKSLYQLQLELYADTMLKEYKSYKFEANGSGLVKLIGDFLLGGTQMVTGDNISMYLKKNGKVKSKGNGNKARNTFGTYLTKRVTKKGYRSHMGLTVDEVEGLLEGKYNSVGFDPYSGRFLFMMNGEFNYQTFELDASKVIDQAGYVQRALYGETGNEGIIALLHAFLSQPQSAHGEPSLNDEGEWDELWRNYFNAVTLFMNNVMKLAKAVEQGLPSTSTGAMSTSPFVDIDAVLGGHAYGGGIGYDPYYPYTQQD